jgi:aerobic carbon-monoxide dehydrogenase medium subunit
VTSTSLTGVEVVVPESREAAISAFGDGSGVTVMGGGTILMPELNYGKRKPERVLLLQKAGLAGIRRDGGTVTIEAMTAVADLSETPPPLATAAAHVADHEIRAQATLGGNICAPPGTESPRGDLQAPLIALGAHVRSTGAGGERREAVEDFLGDRTDSRLVLEVAFEEPRRASFASVRRPHAHAYTILAVTAAETAEGIRVALTGAGPTAIRARSVEAALADGASAEEAAQTVLADAEPRDDALASKWYRERTLPVLVRRALDNLRGGT